MITQISGSPLPIFIPHLLKAEVLTKGREYDILYCSDLYLWKSKKTPKTQWLKKEDMGIVSYCQEF